MMQQNELSHKTAILHITRTMRHNSEVEQSGPLEATWKDHNVTACAYHRLCQCREEAESEAPISSVSPQFTQSSHTRLKNKWEQSPRIQ